MSTDLRSPELPAIRIGTDLALVADVAAAIEKFGDRYLRRVFTAAEVECCRTVTGALDFARLAARFAAKEAAVKAIGGAVEGALADIEVVSFPDGHPELRLRGRYLEAFQRLNANDCQLTMAHEGPFATATVVVLVTTNHQPQGEDPMSDEERRIRQVLVQHGRLNKDAMELTTDDSLYAAGLTSHASVNVMLALEDDFDFEFPEQLLRRGTFESIASLLEAVDSIRGSVVA